jgi:cobalt-zinc-cadmium efflux system protein
VQTRIAADFGITHMTIQLETECCDPDDVHCDLRRLVAHDKLTSHEDTEHRHVDRSL